MNILYVYLVEKFITSLGPVGSFENRGIDQHRSAVGDKRYFHLTGSDQYQFLSDYGRARGHAWCAARRNADPVVQPLDQASSDRSTAFGGCGGSRQSSLPAWEELARTRPRINYSMPQSQIALFVTEEYSIYSPFTARLRKSQALPLLQLYF